MKIPSLDKQTGKDIIANITRLSESYIPQWRFDTEKMDLGTALALIYGDMYEDTLKKWNQLPKKNLLEFFCHAGATLLTAHPSSGYIRFCLVNQEVQGAEVKKGTKLLADTGQGEMVLFETTNDVYVTSGRLLNIFQIHPREDGIYHLYQKQEEDNDWFPKFRFGQVQGENLQSHELYLSHNRIFYMEQEGCIQLLIHSTCKTEGFKEVLERLYHHELITYEYSTEEGFCPFAKVEGRGGEILLYKEKGQPLPAKLEVNQQENYWIRCRIHSIEAFDTLSISHISIGSRMENLRPDIIFASGVEQVKEEYFPFGERMGIYEEAYFASNQVLSKKSAMIELKFQIHFMKIPTQIYGQPVDVNWRPVMKRADFIADPEFDIGIEEVLWEYFNGYDWRRLPGSETYNRIFTPNEKLPNEEIRMKFLCPNDMEPMLVHSAYSYFIRARVTKMNNQFQLKGQYITPILSKTCFSYHYLDPLPVPENLIIKNNLTTIAFKEKELLDGTKCISPFHKLEEASNTLYLGFDKPFMRGPVKLMVQIKESCENRIGSLQFEYYSKTKWKPLNVVDETDGFCKIGILTILGANDFTKKEMWGATGYWIRVSTLKQQLSAKKESVEWPIIYGMLLNTTEILAIETKKPEQFYMEPNKKNVAFRLTSGTIYKIQVWVREPQFSSQEQLEQLEKTYKVHKGNLGYEASEELWVEWVEVTNFSASLPDDRHYMTDRNLGVILFSDGIHGRIPNSDKKETIRVVYQCGGGSKGNLPLGAVTKLNTSIGFINKIENPEITMGGTDQEEVESAIERTGKAFRHRGRGVTIHDYEDIVMESTPNLLKVTCVSNRNVNGAIKFGHIVLVILLKDFKQSKKFFAQTKSQIMKNLCGKIPDQLIKGGRIHIIQPLFIQLSISAKLTLLNLENAFLTRQQLLERLELFLDPMIGNFNHQGWEIGQLPEQIQIKNTIRSIPNIQAITDFRLSASIEQNGEIKEIDLMKYNHNPFVISVNGEHQIEIIVGGGFA